VRSGLVQVVPLPATRATAVGPAGKVGDRHTSGDVMGT